MWKLIALLIGLFCSPTLVHAQSNSERYVLQERCGKQAASTFSKEYVRAEKTKDGNKYFNYENHYSLPLNKCFFLEIMTLIEKGKFSKQYRLFDLNENKEYGSYYDSDATPGYVFCVVRDAQCKSEQEWRTLAKPYLED